MINFHQVAFLHAVIWVNPGQTLWGWIDACLWNIVLYARILLVVSSDWVSQMAAAGYVAIIISLCLNATNPY